MFQIALGAELQVIRRDTKEPIEQAFIRSYPDKREFGISDFSRVLPTGSYYWNLPRQYLGNKVRWTIMNLVSNRVDLQFRVTLTTRICLVRMWIRTPHRKGVMLQADVFIIPTTFSQDEFAILERLVWIRTIFASIICTNESRLMYDVIRMVIASVSGQPIMAV